MKLHDISVILHVYSRISQIRMSLQYMWDITDFSWLFHVIYHEMLRDISHGAGLKSTGHDNASDKAKQNVPSSAGRGFFRRFENIPFQLPFSPSLCPQQPGIRSPCTFPLISWLVSMVTLTHFIFQTYASSIPPSCFKLCRQLKVTKNLV
jgi:hypothetical protein